MKTRRKTRFSVTLALIVANIAFFIIALILLRLFGEKALKHIVLQPVSFSALPWTLLSSMFMHSPIVLAHLIVNMLSLLFLGSFLEQLIGKKRFFLLYIAAGIAGGLFFLLFSLPPFSAIPGLGVPREAMAVGASGAIFGLGGVLALLTPRLPVYVLLIPVAMPLWFGVLLTFIALCLLTAFAGFPIGNAAHLGGLVVGLLYGLYLRLKYPRKVALLDRLFRFRR